MDHRRTVRLARARLRAVRPGSGRHRRRARRARGRLRSRRVDRHPRRSVSRVPRLGCGRSRRHGGRGIGAALLAAIEQRARDLAATQRPERETMLMSFVPVGRPGEDLLRGAGYETARWYIDMVRPDLEEIVEPPMPEGLEIRPVTPEQHEVIWRANREAFRDHWGGADESAEAAPAHPRRPRHRSDPVAHRLRWRRDGRRGLERHPPGRERGARASSVAGSDRSSHAGHGAGAASRSALIGRSLTLLRERGMTSAALGVDVDNHRRTRPVRGGAVRRR